jgi:hypothetical protein
MWTREREAELVQAIADAVAARMVPVSDQEADVYRLSAQLLRTNHVGAAAFLDQAAHQFFQRAQMAPRPFTQIVSEGLVGNLPRLRNLLERRMSGVRSW